MAWKRLKKEILKKVKIHLVSQARGNPVREISANRAINSNKL